MRSGTPSRTAWAAAAHRAAHQVLEGGRIFADPLAVRILGEDADRAIRRAAAGPLARGMRIFIAARTRFAEDALAAAVEDGVRQLVILGAGLDTYAYRGEHRERLRIFEVDHPATQAWKRERLAVAAIPIPVSVAFAPVDFDRLTLADGLAAAGFDAGRRAFFTWLGVVPYLGGDAVWATLGFVAGLAGGAQVAFDYGEPPDALPEDRRAAHEARASRVAEVGEPWVTFFAPEELRARLAATGFSRVEDLGPRQIAARYFPAHAGRAPERGGHVVLAGTV